MRAVPSWTFSILNSTAATGLSAARARTPAHQRRRTRDRRRGRPATRARRRRARPARAPRSAETCNRAATLPPLLPVAGEGAVQADGAADLPEVHRQARRPPGCRAPPSSASRAAGRDALALAVEAQPVDQLHPEARAQDDSLPVVVVGVRAAERELQAIGAERPDRQLRVPEPRQSPTVARHPPRHAQRGVAAGADRQPEVERVGAGEPPAPEVGPRGAERRRCAPGASA